MPTWGHVTMIKRYCLDPEIINAVHLTSVLFCTLIIPDHSDEPYDNWSVEPQRNFRQLFPSEICDKSKASPKSGIHLRQLSD